MRTVCFCSSLAEKSEVDLDGKRSIFVLDTEFSWACPLFPRCCGCAWCFRSAHEDKVSAARAKQDVLGDCSSGALHLVNTRGGRAQLAKWHGHSCTVVLGSTEATPWGSLIRVANWVWSEPGLSQGCQGPVLSSGDFFLSLRHCVPLVSWCVSGCQACMAGYTLGPRVGIASAVTLRVNRQVPAALEPPCRTYSAAKWPQRICRSLPQGTPAWSLLCSWRFLHPSPFLDSRHLACQGARINPFPDLVHCLFSHPQLLGLNWEPLVQGQCRSFLNCGTVWTLIRTDNKECKPIGTLLGGFSEECWRGDSSAAAPCVRSTH